MSFNFHQQPVFIRVYWKQRCCKAFCFSLLAIFVTLFQFSSSTFGDDGSKLTRSSRFKIISRSPFFNSELGSVNNLTFNSKGYPLIGLRDLEKKNVLVELGFPSFRLVQEKTLQLGNEDIIEMAASPEGQGLVIVTKKASGGFKLLLSDTSEYKEKKILLEKRYIFLPMWISSKFLVVLSEENSPEWNANTPADRGYVNVFWMINIETGEIVVSEPLEGVSPRFSVSKDGRVVIATTRGGIKFDGTKNVAWFHIFDPESKSFRKIYELQLSTGEYHSWPKWTNDGKHVVLGKYRMSHRGEIPSLKDGAEIQSPFFIVDAESGQKVLEANAENGLKIWASPLAVHVLPEHDLAVTTGYKNYYSNFKFDFSYLGEIVLWDLKTGMPIDSQLINYDVHQVVVHPQNNQFVTIGNPGYTLRQAWEIADLKYIK